MKKQSRVPPHFEDDGQDAKSAAIEHILTLARKSAALGVKKRHPAPEPEMQKDGDELETEGEALDPEGSAGRDAAKPPLREDYGDAGGGREVSPHKQRNAARSEYARARGEADELESTSAKKRFGYGDSEDGTEAYTRDPHRNGDDEQARANELRAQARRSLKDLDRAGGNTKTLDDTPVGKEETEDEKWAREAIERYQKKNSGK